jgi:hypothetical protein
MDFTFFIDMVKLNRNSKIAEFVGLSFGDGGLTDRGDTNRKRYQLRGDLREEKEFYDNYVIPLFNKEVMIPLFNRNVGIVFNKNKNFYGLSVESVGIEKSFNRIGIPTGVKEELFVPKWIKNNRNYIINFLRGLFDTDGSIWCEKNYSLKNPKFHTKVKLNLSTTSKTFAKELLELVSLVGIKCFLKKYVYKSKSWRDLYIIMIDGGINVKKWFELIGSNNSKHVTKYEIWMKFGFCPPKTILNERRKILKGELDILDRYAEVPERSNGLG